MTYQYGILRVTTGGRMESYEKEELLYSVLMGNINHFLKENNMTYFQIIGTLDTIKSEFKNDFFIASDSLTDEEN